MSPQKKSRIIAPADEIISVHSALKEALLKKTHIVVFKSLDLTDQSSDTYNLDGGDFILGFNFWGADDAGNSGWDFFTVKMDYGANVQILDDWVTPSHFQSVEEPIFKFPVPIWYKDGRSIKVERNYFGGGNLEYLKVVFLVAGACA